LDAGGVPRTWPEAARGVEGGRRRAAAGKKARRGFGPAAGKKAGRGFGPAAGKKAGRGRRLGGDSALPPGRRRGGNWGPARCQQIEKMVGVVGSSQGRRCTS
jgi:hypothetical protein